jgi:hypothetical protein
MGRTSLKLSGLGSGPALRATYRYKVTLMRTDGQIVELVAHGRGDQSIEPGCD